MAIGYTYTWPNQPYTGGTEKGYPIYSYNPFLESGFGVKGSTGSPMTDVGVVINPKNARLVTINRVGAQTNCMSCHALATYTTSNPYNNQSQTYYADTYIDMVTNRNFKDPGSKYKKKLKLDFLWSIDNNLLPH